METIETTALVRKPLRVPPANEKPVPFSIKMVGLIFKYPGRWFPSFAARVALKMFMTPKRFKVKEMPSIYDEAFVLGVSYPGGKVKAYWWGYTGKIVLLVHGWESGIHAFEYFIPELVAAGYRVVAIEGPAHGDSRQRRTNMVDFGNALQAVLERLEKSGGVSVMIGHSFGGSTLVHVLKRFPAPAALEKVVLIAMPARIDHVFFRYFRTLQLPLAVIKKFKGYMKQLFNLELDALQVRYWCGQIKTAPVLIVHDRHDKVIPFQEAEELVAHWPMATLLETEDLGHFRIMKNREVINEIVQFL